MSEHFEKVTWQDVGHYFKKLNKSLFEIIDEISPDLPIMLAKYPYGFSISDPNYFYFPRDAQLEPIPAKESPYCFLLKNKMQTYLKYKHKIIPGTIYTPGSFFPQNFEVSRFNEIRIRPKAIFYLSSGVRNLHMMPLIRESDSYQKLKKYFKISENLSPDNIADHYEIFLSMNKQNDSNWHSSMLIFDNKWKDKIFFHPKWYRLKEYILLQSIKVNSCKRNAFYLDHAINDITRNNKIKNKSLSNEMIKYILYIAIGELPGLRPATDSFGAPIEHLTSLFNDVYLPSTTPVMIEPHSFNLYQDTDPIYLSLLASTFNLSDEKTFRPLTYLDEISNSLNIYLKEFKIHPFTKDTIFENLNDKLKIHYYSVMGDAGKVKNAEQLLKDDKRFKLLYNQSKADVQYGFTKRSVFTKALVSIKPGLKIN